MLTIRNEEPRDYEIVERMTRNSFYNLYIPGCMEHYLVHIMREHKDFIPELDFVLELDNKVVGYIMYTRATLTDEKGNMKHILTFGPLCIEAGSLPSTGTNRRTIFASSTCWPGLAWKPMPNNSSC